MALPPPPAVAPRRPGTPVGTAAGMPVGRLTELPVGWVLGWGQVRSARQLPGHLAGGPRVGYLRRTRWSARRGCRRRRCIRARSAAFRPDLNVADGRPLCVADSRPLHAADSQAEGVSPVPTESNTCRRGQHWLNRGYRLRRGHWVDRCGPVSHVRCWSVARMQLVVGQRSPGHWLWSRWWVGFSWDSGRCSCGLRPSPRLPWPVRW